MKHDYHSRCNNLEKFHLWQLAQSYHKWALHHLVRSQFQIPLVVAIKVTFLSTVFVLSYPSARRLSWVIPPDAGFQCDNSCQAQKNDKRNTLYIKVKVPHTTASEKQVFYVKSLATLLDPQASTQHF